MSKNAAIEIFLRVRPTKKPFKGLNLNTDDSKLNIHVDKDSTQGYVNNQREDYNFLFNGMFGMEAKQEDIFNGVAKDVVDSALDGYNGTIFAYGQTGSGKTYTMTGGVEKYTDRGIIPRTLSYIFHETRNRTETFFKVSVSYIEIYDNEGYDLLDENHTSTNLKDLPKVIPRERPDETLILSGLSVHKAENEDQALKLLFIGDTNRAVSETPMNDASTRSHCIFIIQIEGERAGSDGKKTQARLYLVDLSGSERVGKTGVTDILLKEARFINLSLHYLEHVIICLNKKSNGENIHIPYRNSLMTLILRDSLGGNSKTRMVATISAESSDVEEGISTCKFAQRVALIKNSLLKNEAVDPQLIIQKLKKENEELRAELAFVKGGNGKTSLDSADVEECRKIVEDFITNPDPGAKIILKDMLMISECFYHFKHRFNDLNKKFDKQATQTSTKKILGDGLDVDTNKLKPSENIVVNNEEIKRLKLLIQQRDNEIAILLNLLNKQKGSDQNGSMLVPLSNAQGNTSVIMSENQAAVEQYKPIAFKEYEESKLAGEGTPKKDKYKEETTKPLDIVQKKIRNEESVMSRNQAPQRNEMDDLLVAPINLTNEQLKDRAACFELFRKSYRKNQALEENKELLKEKFALAKELGVQVTSARDKITAIKNQIEELRRENAMRGMLDGGNVVLKHPDEDRLASEIEKQKKIYKDKLPELKDAKAEIGNIQTLLERNHQKLQKDFEKWLEIILNQNSYVTVANNNNTLQESQKANLDISGSSSSSRNRTNSKIGPDVEKNLAAFYKARDDLYKQTM